MNKLNTLIDSLQWAVPFSLLGAVFGDAIRKEVLTPRQRLVVGLFSFVMGPLCGAAANREFGAGEFTSYVIAAVAPTFVFDVIGLVAAVIHSAEKDPRGWVGAIASLFPWGRK